MDPARLGAGGRIVQDIDSSLAKIRSFGTLPLGLRRSTDYNRHEQCCLVGLDQARAENPSLFYCKTENREAGVGWSGLSRFQLKEI